MGKKKQGRLPMKSIDREADRQFAATKPGQAHLAGTGPEGMSCRQCVHWGSKRKDGLPGPQVYRAQCGKYIDLTKVKTAPAVPRDAAACRHFEPNGAVASKSIWG